MKFKMLKRVMAFLVVAAIAAWHVYLSSKAESLFDVTLAGNEALAQGEYDHWGECQEYHYQFDQYQDCGGNSVIVRIEHFYICDGKSVIDYCLSGTNYHYFNCDGYLIGIEDYVELVVCGELL